MNKSLILFAGVLGIALSACTQTETISTDSPETTPLETLEVDSVDYGFFAAKLKCARFAEHTSTLGLGVTWRDITIGASTYTEVREKLLSEGEEYESSKDFLRFVRLDEDDIWTEVQACFNDDTLSLMKILAPLDFQMTIEEWVSKYGAPDLVTWGVGYDDRSIVWVEHGILVNARYFLPDEWISTWVILFPPLDRDNFQNTWIVAGLPKSLQGSPNDVEPHAPMIEDPWEIEQP